jgi:hypothetical protein
MTLGLMIRSRSPAMQKRFTQGEASPTIGSVISIRFGKKLRIAIDALLVTD